VDNPIGADSLVLQIVRRCLAHHVWLGAVDSDPARFYHRRMHSTEKDGASAPARPG
jgi:hypothetical protein